MRDPFLLGWIAGLCFGVILGLFIARKGWPHSNKSGIDRPDINVTLDENFAHRALESLGYRIQSPDRCRKQLH